ncbi:MAG: SGNH/GDSL hydrolase family protein [Chloroflexi bacterium]|nr:SGNH/GDSL hydrolase family protein [Chloroflexota bacterium]
MAFQSPRDPKAIGPVIVGALCICGAVGMDPRLVGPVFSPDGVIGNPIALTAIRAAQAIAGLLGIGMLVLRYRIPGDLLLRIVLRVIFAITAVVLACAAAEIFIRIYHPHPLRPDKTHLLFRHHDTYGHAFIPGKEAIACAPYQFVQKIKVNSHGMRDREYSLKKRAGVRRIAAIGDSFTAGLEVKADEVFTEVMERDLGSGWEVLNFGVSGYSTLHEYLYLRDSILDFDPDVILLVFYVRNDLDEMQGRYYDERRSGPIADVDNEGSLLIRNIPVPKPAGLLQDGAPRPFLQITDSHLFNFIHLRLKVRERILVNSYPEVRHFNPTLTPRLRKDYRILNAVIEKFAELCKSRDIPLVLVYAPTILQVYPADYWEPVRDSQGLPDTFDVNTPVLRTEEIAKQHHLLFLDLTSPLRERAATGARLYFTWNQHWNHKGHETVSNAITDYLNAALPHLIASRRETDAP